MSYRSRSARRLAKKSRRNLLITLLLTAFIIFATVNWVLPQFINGMGFVTNVFKSTKSVKQPAVEDTTLAPPSLVIPFEATNTAEINISGFSQPDAKVEIYVDDDLKKEVPVSPDGSFFAENVPLSPGTNNIWGKTTDSKYTSLPSKIIKVVSDNEKPLLEIYEPEDGKSIQGESKIKVSGKTEPNAIVSVNDSRVITGFDGSFSTQLELHEGENILNIKAIDNASNINEALRRVNFTL